MPAASEARITPFTVDSRGVTPDQLRMIAAMTGGEVTSTDRDFFDIPYLTYGRLGYGRGCEIRFGEHDNDTPDPSTRISLYGYDDIDWHNPSMEFSGDSVTLTSRDWDSRGDRLVVNKDRVQLIIARPAPQEAPEPNPSV